MNLSKQNQFVRNWWKQAQKQGTILTKPVRYRQLKESLKKDYVPKSQYDLLQFQHQQILLDVDYQLQTHTKQENEQLKQDITEWNERYGELEANLNEQAQQAKLQQKEIKDQSQAEKQLYLTKITDLEQALFDLAKQKLKGKKEARELLNQIETNWQEKADGWHETKTTLENELTQQKQVYGDLILANKKQTNLLQDELTTERKRVSSLREDLSNQQTKLKEEKKEAQKQLTEKDTKINELENWSAGQHNRILDLEKQIQAHELSQEQSQREYELAQEEIKNLKQQLTSSQLKETELNKINEQTNLKLTNRENTLKDTQTKLTQTSQKAQQDGQAKQSQINQLQTEKLTQQNQIIHLTQELTQKTQTIADQLSQINQKDEKLTRQKGVLEQLLANREQRLNELGGEHD